MATSNCLSCWAELWTQDLDGACRHRVKAGYIYDDPHCDVDNQICARFALFDALVEVYLCEPLQYGVRASILYRYSAKKTREDNLADLRRQIEKRYARIFEAGNAQHRKFQMVIVKKHPEDHPEHIDHINHDHINQRTYDAGLDKDDQANTGNTYLVAPE